MHLNRTSPRLYFAVTHTGTTLATYPSFTSPLYRKSWIDMLPLKRKTLVTRVKIPWFNADVLQLKRFRRKAEWKALKSGLSSDWLAYWKICNRYSALLKSTRTSYYTDLIDQCAGDSRKLFKLVTFLCKDPSDSDLPPHDD